MVGPGNDVLRSLVPGDMDLLELEEDAEQGELVDYEEESPVEPLPMQEDQDDDRQGKDAEESSKGDKDRKPISWQAWKGPEHSEKQAANTREKEEKPVKEIQAKGEQPPLMKAERSKPASRPKDCSRDRDRLPPSKAAPSSSKRHVQLRRQSPPPRGRSPPRKKRSPPPSHRQQRRETPPRGRSPPHLRHSMSRRHSPPAQRRHSTHRSRSPPLRPPRPHYLEQDHYSLPRDYHMRPREVSLYPVDRLPREDYGLPRANSMQHPYSPPPYPRAEPDLHHGLLDDHRMPMSHDIGYAASELDRLKYLEHVRLMELESIERKRRELEIELNPSLYSRGPMDPYAPQYLQERPHPWGYGLPEPEHPEFHGRPMSPPQYPSGRSPSRPRMSMGPSSPHRHPADPVRHAGRPNLHGSRKGDEGKGHESNSVEPRLHIKPAKHDDGRGSVRNADKTPSDHPQRAGRELVDRPRHLNKGSQRDLKTSSNATAPDKAEARARVSDKLPEKLPQPTERSKRPVETKPAYPSKRQSSEGKPVVQLRSSEKDDRKAHHASNDAAINKTKDSPYKGDSSKPPRDILATAKHDGRASESNHRDSADFIKNREASAREGKRADLKEPERPGRNDTKSSTHPARDKSSTTPKGQSSARPGEGAADHPRGSSRVLQKGSSSLQSPHGSRDERAPARGEGKPQASAGSRSPKKESSRSVDIRNSKVPSKADSQLQSKVETRSAQNGGERPGSRDEKGKAASKGERPYHTKDTTGNSNRKADPKEPSKAVRRETSSSQPRNSSEVAEEQKPEPRPTSSKTLHKENSSKTPTKENRGSGISSSKSSAKIDSKPHLGSRPRYSPHPSAREDSKRDSKQSTRSRDPPRDTKEAAASTRDTSRGEKMPPPAPLSSRRPADSSPGSSRREKAKDQAASRDLPPLPPPPAKNQRIEQQPLERHAAMDHPASTLEQYRSRSGAALLPDPLSRGSLVSDRLQDASLRQRDSSSFPPLLPAESLGDLRYLPSPPAMLDTRGLISSRDVALEGSYPPRLRSGVIVGTSEHSQWGPALPLSSMPMPMSMPSAIDYRGSRREPSYHSSQHPVDIARRGSVSRAPRDDSHHNEWYYRDPQGVVQGPSSKSQLKIWLDQLAAANDRNRYQAFCRVIVWRDGMRQSEGIELLRLLSER